MMRQISQACIDIWGFDAQMLMVAEEALELAHAVLKHRRAFKRYSASGASLTRDEEFRDVDYVDPHTRQLTEKAHARVLAKVIKSVQTEAMQVTFMIDQLKLMLPGDYTTILEAELEDTANLLRQRGANL